MRKAGQRLLLVIGIHREELAFGQAVAAALGSDAGTANVDVLVIPDGLSGRRPLPGERFRYDTLHQALYRQLMGHIRPHHAMLLDLHTGLDPHGPCADLYCRDVADLERLLPTNLQPAPRLVLLGDQDTLPSAETVIPEAIWRHPTCLYVGLEVFLPEPGPGRDQDQAYGRQLVAGLAAGLGGLDGVAS